jgi:hypothetical protein
MQRNRVIYRNKGVAVEVVGTLIVRLPNGSVVDRYPVEEIESAIDTADEVAEKLAA